MLGRLGWLALGLCWLAGCAGEADRPLPAPVAPPAAYGAWRSCQIGGGGNVSGVVLGVSDPRRWYAYVDIGGCYRSDDAGGRWRMLHGALPARDGAYMVRGLSVDPRDADRLLVASGSDWSAEPGDVFLSRDGGASFASTLRLALAGNNADRTAGRILVRQPDQPDTVLVASPRDGVWRSLDGGASWTVSGLRGVNAVAIVHDRRDGRQVWLCAQAGRRRIAGREAELHGGLFRSGDGGGTWERVADAAPSEMVQAPWDADQWYGIIDRRPVRSRDGGRTWEAADQGLPGRVAGDALAGSFAALAAGPGFLLAGMGTGALFRREAGAEAWAPVARQAMTARYEGRDWYKRSEIGKALNDIVIDPRDAAHWLFSDWYALYESRDAGRTWDMRIDGMEITAIHAIEADPADPAIVHLGMADNGYFRSCDGGATFAQVGTAGGISNNVRSIVPAPSRPARVYAVGCRTWHWEANQVFVSDDRGASWRRAAMRGLGDMERQRCNSLAVLPDDPDHLLLAVSGRVGEGGGVWRSRDAGATWTPDGDGLPAAELFQHEIWHYGRELAVDAAGAALCFSKRQDRLFRRDPGAGRWEAVADFPGAHLNGVEAGPGAGTFYAVADGLWASADAGRTWRRLLGAPVDQVGVDRRVAGRLAASVPREGVRMSEDGGATWRRLDAALPYRLPFMPVAIAGGRVLAGSDGSGAFWCPVQP